MGVVARPAGFQRRLVGALAGGLLRFRGCRARLRCRRVLPGLVFLAAILCAGIPAFGQAASSPGGPVAKLTLASTQEVLSSRCSRIHENPLNLLFLLPGSLLLMFAAIVRGRRGLLVLLVAGALGVGLLGADDDPSTSPAALLEQAERSFAKGEVEEALALYREAGSLLPCSPALERNLGVCYARSGEIGYAVLHLRRSLRARPAEPLTRQALAAVEKEAGLEGQLPMPVSVNPDVLYVITLVLANLSLGAAGFALRRKGVRALIVMILLTISAGIALGFFLGLLRAENRPVGVVVAQEVGLLKIPEAEARASFVLPSGTSLLVRGKAGEYYLVETASRFRGWVPEEAIVLD